MSGAEVDPRGGAGLAVSSGRGGQRRGSGYRVNARAMLTAAHVVEEAASVVVRFDGGTEQEWCARADRILMTDGDLAVVLLPAEYADEVVETAQFGRLA